MSLIASHAFQDCHQDGMTWQSSEVSENEAIASGDGQRYRCCAYSNLRSTNQVQGLASRRVRNQADRDTRHDLIISRGTVACHCRKLGQRGALGAAPSSSIDARIANQSTEHQRQWRENLELASWISESGTQTARWFARFSRRMVLL